MKVDNRLFDKPKPDRGSDKPKPTIKGEPKPIKQ